MPMLTELSFSVANIKHLLRVSFPCLSSVILFNISATLELSFFTACSNSVKTKLKREKGVIYNLEELTFQIIYSQNLNSSKHDYYDIFLLKIEEGGICKIWEPKEVEIGSKTGCEYWTIRLKYSLNLEKYL